MTGCSGPRFIVEGCRGSLIGYCLMSNHVHLVLVPKEPKALARALRQSAKSFAADPALIKDSI